MRMSQGRKDTEMTVKKGLVHGIAECQTCDWFCEDYLTVQRKAAEHSKKTGHTVKADLGYVVEYSYPGKKRDEPAKKGY